MPKSKPLNAFIAARNNVGLSQKQAHLLTGIPQSTISELEAGDNTNPTWTVLGKLCVLYRRRPEELMGGWPKLPGQTRTRFAKPFASNIAAMGM